MNIETREKLYEGKAKIVYETNQPGKIIQYSRTTRPPSTR